MVRCWRWLLPDGLTEEPLCFMTKKPGPFGTPMNRDWWVFRVSIFKNGFRKSPLPIPAGGTGKRNIHLQKSWNEAERNTDETIQVDVVYHYRRFFIAVPGFGLELKIATLSPEGSVWMDKMQTGAAEIHRKTEMIMLKPLVSQIHNFSELFPLLIKSFR